ncbi:MAG: hypothetical protein PHO89_01170 [Methylacidiphilaceae bacterium]|nr:hypothetical protein [Candidatus Methylacidiphilaceae bacterium]
MAQRDDWSFLSLLTLRVCAGTGERGEENDFSVSDGKPTPQE